MGKRLEHKFDYMRAKVIWKNSGLKLTYLAAKLEISRSYLGQVLSGKCNPSLTVVRNLAAALETTEDELLRSTDAA